MNGLDEKQSQLYRRLAGSINLVAITIDHAGRPLIFTARDAQTVTAIAMLLDDLHQSDEIGQIAPENDPKMTDRAPNDRVEDAMQAFKQAAE